MYRRPLNLAADCIAHSTVPPDVKDSDSLKNYKEQSSHSHSVCCRKPLKSDQTTRNRREEEEDEDGEERREEAVHPGLEADRQAPKYTPARTRAHTRERSISFDASGEEYPPPLSRGTRDCRSPVSTDTTDLDPATG
ncbi:hypothetical protein BHM03_00044640 [Ensete ventricosum]|nr:hypothetical protein BHM03_00044640 [Ensete ventricosum]